MFIIDHCVGRKWRRMNLTEFARLFNLAEMEKQAYVLNKVRARHFPHLNCVSIIIEWLLVTIATFKVGIKSTKKK